MTLRHIRGTGRSMAHGLARLMLIISGLLVAVSILGASLFGASRVGAP